MTLAVALTPGERAAAAARRRWRIEHLPAAECGTWMGRSVVGPSIGTDCYIAHRDSYGVVAGPQTGKTELLGHHILDFPGAVVSTSTKTDLYLVTAALRARRASSRRVELFNPEGLGGLVSTFRWSPVRGCSVPAVARQRAGHLVGAVASGADDGDRWDQWAVGVLAALLMAADRAHRDMATVASWVYSERVGSEVALGLLREAAGRPVPQLVIDALTQLTDSSLAKTRSSIFMSMRDAVGFMAIPEVATMCCPTEGEAVFDVASFLADRGTLYVLGSDEQYSGTAPLLAALTGHLFDTAKHLATFRPAGRLDPGLLVCLDEVALITPVPLDRWLADAGGRGIHVGWAVQSFSQLVGRWNEQGARTILNATNAIVWLGGTKDPDDLDAVAKLAGTRLELVPDPDGDGPGHARFERVPVIPPERVRMLEVGHGVLIQRACPATIVRYTEASRRRDVRDAGAPPSPGPIRRNASDVNEPRDEVRELIEA